MTGKYASMRHMHDTKIDEINTPCKTQTDSNKKTQKLRHIEKNKRK